MQRNSSPILTAWATAIPHWPGWSGRRSSFWSVGITAAVLVCQHCAAGGTWAWSYQRINASVLCIVAGLAAGLLTAHAAVQQFRLDLVVATYTARRTKACRKFEQAIADGKVISLSRDVVDDILRRDCNYLRLMIASEQPGSRLKFVRRYEPGPKGTRLDYTVGVPG